MMKDLRESTADDGTYLMVELNLSQELHENMNLFGRVMYPQSTLYCMTCSLSHGGEGLGAFMGEDRARQMAEPPASVASARCLRSGRRCRRCSNCDLTALSGTAGTATVG